MSKEFLIFLLLLLAGFILVCGVVAFGAIVAWKLMWLLFGILYILGRWTLIIVGAIVIWRWTWKK